MGLLDAFKEWFAPKQVVEPEVRPSSPETKAAGPASKAPGPEMKFAVQVKNSGKTRRSFALESWGGRYHLAPGQSYRVEIESSGTPIVEIELGDEEDILTLDRGDATVFDGTKQVKAK